jgi:hypothetical protein
MADAPAAPPAAAAAAAAPPPPPTMEVGGRAVCLLNDAHFGALRTALGYDSWLPAALAAFDWGKMAAGGGKGGDKMARTPCKRLFVKEVSAGDNATLSHEGFLKARARRRIARRGARAGERYPNETEGLRQPWRVVRALSLSRVRRAQAYVARVSTGKSLIVHIVAHFARPDGQTCMVMNNWLPVRVARRSLACALRFAFAFAASVRLCGAAAAWRLRARRRACGSFAARARRGAACGRAAGVRAPRRRRARGERLAARAAAAAAPARRSAPPPGARASQARTLAGARVRAASLAAHGGAAATQNTPTHATTAVARERAFPAALSDASLLGASLPQPSPSIAWARLYDLKGTRDDKTLMVDNEPLPEARARARTETAHMPAAHSFAALICSPVFFSLSLF